MKVLSTLQVWTTPLWLILMVAPFVYLVISHPDSVSQFFAYAGENGKGGFDIGSTLLAAGVCLSLIARSQSRTITCVSCRRRLRRTSAAGGRG